MLTKLFSRELLWAIYGFIQALENTGKASYKELARKWQIWMDYTKTTAAQVCRTPLTSLIYAKFHILN
jgi:hypothetical protein